MKKTDINPLTELYAYNVHGNGPYADLADSRQLVVVTTQLVTRRRTRGGERSYYLNDRSGVRAGSTRSYGFDGSDTGWLVIKERHIQSVHPEKVAEVLRTAAKEIHARLGEPGEYFDLKTPLPEGIELEVVHPRLVVSTWEEHQKRLGSKAEHQRLEKLKQKTEETRQHHRKADVYRLLIELGRKEANPGASMYHWSSLPQYDRVEIQLDSYVEVLKELAKAREFIRRVRGESPLPARVEPQS